MGFLNNIVKGASLGLIDDFDGSEGAAAAGRQATADQIAESRRQFDIEQEAIRPFREIGLQNFQTLNALANSPDQTAEGRLQRIRNAFQSSPGFANRLNLGRDQIEQGAAAQGTLFSGNTLKGLERFRQNLASDEFNNFYNQYNQIADNRLNRIANLSNTGQTATSQLIDSGRNNSNNIIQAHGNLGQINAAASVAPFNSFLNLVNTGANLYGAGKKPGGGLW